VIVGAQTTGGLTRGLTIGLFNVSGPGTYALGVSCEVFGGTGSGAGAQTWITDNTGNAGTITLTTLSPTRWAATRTVTAGSLDLAFSGNSFRSPPRSGAS